MYRFFVEPEQIREKTICMTGNDVNHIKNVLRMKKEEQLIISNGQGQEYYCIIDSITNDEIILNIESTNQASNELKTKLYLFQGMPKKDKMELIIQKAVELGVYQIIPVITARTIVKFDNKKEQKVLERWNSISESAAKQAGRGIIPVVKPPMTYKEALDYAKELDVNLVPYEKAVNIGETKDIIKNINCNSVGVFVGPEGGFEERELNSAIDIGANPITLGKRILRTETAGLMLLSLLMFQIEED